MKTLIRRAVWVAALTAPALALAAAPDAVHSQDTRQTATVDRDLAVAQHLIDLHFEIWNDPNPANWPAKYPQVYSHDFFLADYAGLARGYQAVGKMIEKVQGAHPGFAFTPEPVTWNHGVGRVTWGYGPRDNPNLIRGEDIFTIEGGKLASARVFINSK